MKARQEHSKTEQNKAIVAARKIQKFWRKTQIRSKFEQVTATSMGQIEKIQAELRVFNKIPSVLKIQQIWRLRTMAKNARKSKLQKCLYKAIREFQEDTEDPIPTSYLVQIFKAGNGLKIALICNNKAFQSVMIDFKIQETVNDQQKYFEDLVHNRLKFIRRPFR